MQSAVDDLDRKLVHEHEHDTSLFDRLTEKQRQTGILHGKRPICRFLRPYFLPETRYREIKDAAWTLYGAFGEVTAAALRDNAIADELGLLEAELRAARIDPGYQDISITSRLDTFMSRDGFAFLEYNAENPAGIGDQPSLENLFSEVPLVKGFLASHDHFYPQPHRRLLDSLDSAYRARGGQRAKPNIAIVDWTGVDTSPEFEILGEHFRSQGHDVRICDPNELEYSGGVLSAGGFRVDIFYKRVIIHEYLQAFDESHALLRACADGNVCMVNSFRTKIPHKKASFAVLTDEKYSGLFTTAQRAVIQDHIPWTRRVAERSTTFRDRRVDLVPLVRSRRDGLILKPNDDYGGHGIILGWESSERAWDDAIQAALTEPYVVQERVGNEKVEMPAFAEGTARMETLNVDFDPFLFRGEVEGGMVRLAPGSLVNITQGGGETALAILKGC
ncbi:MAG: hypothetical protein JO053_09090 [Acidobacteria bacterium]|nr:hypothetical protein [Acidobacteriota bacterium]